MRSRGMVASEADFQVMLFILASLSSQLSELFVLPTPRLRGMWEMQKGLVLSFPCCEFKSQFSWVC